MQNNIKAEAFWSHSCKAQHRKEMDSGALTVTSDSYLLYCASLVEEESVAATLDSKLFYFDEKNQMTALESYFQNK